MGRTIRAATIVAVGLVGYAVGAWTAPADAAPARVARPSVVEKEPEGRGPDEAQPLQCVDREACCKVCSKGQACGDTCISREKRCHKGRGCACDAGEVCE